MSAAEWPMNEKVVMFFSKVTCFLAFESHHELTNVHTNDRTLLFSAHCAPYTCPEDAGSTES